MSWSSSAPSLPSGSSWGNTATASFEANTWKVSVTMKSARGVGNTFYVRIQATFNYGEDRANYYPPSTVYFFVGDDFKGYATPDSVGTTLTRYYTGSSSSTSTRAGVSTKSGQWSSGVSATSTITVASVMTYTVSYNGNGSTGGSTSSQTKTSGTALTLRQNGYTRTGYNFVKWNTKADGSGTSYNAGASYTANAAVTLYAQWIKANIPVYVNVGGTIHQVDKAYANVGGTIKEVTVYANVGGTIKTLV